MNFYEYLNRTRSHAEDGYGQSARRHSDGSVCRAKDVRRCPEFRKLREERNGVHALSSVPGVRTEVGGVPVAAAGIYDEGDYRELAHRMKDGDPSAIEEAARRMSKIVLPNSVLVPVPSHTGRSTYTKDLAEAISRMSGCHVVDALEGLRRESLYSQKKAGVKPSVESLGLRIRNGVSLPSDGSPILFVDNVVATGTTARACRSAAGSGSMLSLAVDPRVAV